MITTSMQTFNTHKDYGETKDGTVVADKLHILMKKMERSPKTVFTKHRIVSIIAGFLLLCSIYAFSYLKYNWGFLGNGIHYFEIDTFVNMTGLTTRLPTTVDHISTSPVQTASNTSVQPKRILFWVPFFSSRDYYFGFGRDPFVRRGCAVDTCETTDNRSLLSSSDAVIFHIRNVAANDLPPRRDPLQRWIFFSMESPDHTAYSVPHFTGPYNWTMTYRMDSDVPTPYFAVRQKLAGNATDSNPRSTTPARRKKNMGLIAWLVSNCDTESERELYVAELKKHIPVSIYGKCGEKCPKESSSDGCRQLAMGEHKFYLSFENSICRDYVTEKLSNPLQVGAVPVVYGGANYTVVAPPGSYIDIHDFPSPRHLADHLLWLDSNDTAYNAYFQWKEKFDIDSNSAHFCNLCAKLHNDHKPKVYEDIYEWWVDGGHCKPRGYVNKFIGMEEND